MQANSRFHNYFSFIGPFECGNCGKEGKKIQKTEYLENKKSILGKLQNIFYDF